MAELNTVTISVERYEKLRACETAMLDSSVLQRNHGLYGQDRDYYSWSTLYSKDETILKMKSEMKEVSDGISEQNEILEKENAILKEEVKRLKIKKMGLIERCYHFLQN